MIEIPQLNKKPGTALVLSGGATKAFYFHLGVLKLLRHEPLSAIVGSSAGSILGAFLASGATLDNMLTALYQKEVYLPRFDAWVKTLTSSMLFRPSYRRIGRQAFVTSLETARFLLSLPVLYNKDWLGELMERLIISQTEMSGLFNAVALENLFKSLLPSADFADTEIDLYITATALDTHTRAVFNGLYNFQSEQDHFMTDVPIHKAVRASCSVPGLFEPVKIKGHHYIDGELKRTLSADIGVSLADRVIVSHTYQPLHAESEYGSVSDLGWLNILRQSTSIVFYERIAIWRKLYQERHPETEIIWIEPEPDDIDFFLAPEFTFKPEVQKMLIDKGEAAALRALSGVIA